MLTDPIADLLTILRNASQKGHTTVVVRFSKLKENVAQVLKQEGFIQDVKKIEDNKLPFLEIYLLEERPLNLKRVSKPGRRMYVRSTDIKKVKNGLGITILSTSQGVLSNKEAFKKHVGGELLCEVY